MAALDYSQFKGKPFQVISRLGVRYTGIFDSIDQADQTICLSQVYNHGTEDRPVQRKIQGNSKTLGWVRFRTDSIESLNLVENYVPPGQEEEPLDPILASVSRTGPGQSGPSTASGPPPLPAQSRQQPPSQPSQPQSQQLEQQSLSQPPQSQQQSQRHELPSRPPASSANTALDRVQQSLSDLAVDGRTRRTSSAPRAPEVPDAAFDFSGTEQFEKEREAMKAQTGRRESASETNENGGEGGGDEDETDDLGGPINPPHPSAVVSSSNGNGLGATSPGEGKPAAATYTKSSFFDNLSSGTSRVSRADERHRNLDTFGEAGGAGGGHAHSFGGGGRGRGGFGQGQGRGGFNQMGGGGGGFGQGQRGGYGRGGYNQSGFGGRGGMAGGQGQNGFRGPGQGQGGWRGRRGGGGGGYGQGGFQQGEQ